jgi:hypothetical protein
MNNNQLFLQKLEQIDPNLFVIRQLLAQTKVNPAILPFLIRSLYNLSIGSGYGKIEIYMSAGRVTQIRTEETSKVERVVMTKR